jgi:hypothetical protein
MDRIVIVGGGTAGWMSAITLATHFPNKKIVVIDPSSVGPLGVGESVTGAVQRFITYPFHGLDQAEFFRKADATLKLGIWYKDWTKTGEEYLTPIDAPTSYFDHRYYQDIEDFYALSTAGGQRLGEVQLHSPLMRENRTDYYRHEGKISSQFSMASCHFDAIKLAAWLREECQRRHNIEHVDALVTGYEQDAETGFVINVRVDSGQEISGDFFLDCSGFRRLLLAPAYEPRWVDFSRHIKVDRAIPSPAPYEPNAEIPVYTMATAMKNGWMWQVPTQSRLGKGYIYSSKYTSDEDAIAEMRSAGVDPGDSPRIMKFSPGKYESIWCGNVCAVGLAGGFIEALEATTIHIMYVQMKALTEIYLPFFNKESAAPLAAKYNGMMDQMYDDFVDFVSYHYHSGRDDTEFWRDYQKPEAMTETNAAKREMWKHRYPVREDFNPQTSDRFFTSTSLIVWMPMLCGLNQLQKSAAEELVRTSKYIDLGNKNVAKYLQIREHVRKNAITQRETIEFLRS